MPRKTKPVRYCAMRMLILLFVMGDAIRRIFDGVRPFDWILLGIEFVILVVIVGEFYLTVKDRQAAKAEKRESEQYLQRKIESLTPEERNALKLMILMGGQPTLDITNSLRNKIYGLVVQNPASRLEISPDHALYLRRWAEKP